MILILFETLFRTVITPSTESTLSLKRSDLQSMVADFVGLGRAIPTNTDDLSRVNEAVDSGMRSVYWPDVIAGETTSHEWSWMRPVMTFDTSSGFDAYQLPSTFGGIEGDLTYAEGQSYHTIAVRGEQFIRGMQQTPSNSGVPQYAAVRALDSGNAGQRYELVLWPTPDAVYSLTFRYNINPDALGSANDYPLGGPSLSETVLQACRAAADRIFNDSVGQEHALFKERLRAAIQYDRRSKVPERLGFAYDPGQFVQDRFFPLHSDSSVPSFSFNGIDIQ